MQIHELNNRKKSRQIQEAPQIWKSLTSNTAAAQAKQSATQQTAAKLADKLAKQGYTVAAGTSLQQQLQATQSNAAIQQQIKSLGSQWAAQSAALKKSSVTETAVAQFDPRDLEDPKYASVLKALQAQGVNPTQQTQQPSAQNLQLEKQLSRWKLEFNTWAKTRLSNLGINVDVIRRDPEIQKMLDSALSEIAVAAQSGNAKLEAQAVNDYFNAAIAGNIFVRSGGASTAPGVAPVQSSQKPTASTFGDMDVLNRNNIQLSADQMQALNLAIRRDLKGGSAIRNTGSTVLNALARAIGLQVGQ